MHFERRGAYSSIQPQRKHWSFELDTYYINTLYLYTLYMADDDDNGCSSMYWRPFCILSAGSSLKKMKTKLKYDAR